jgi:nucleoid DNA-binding protein
VLCVKPVSGLEETAFNQLIRIIVHTRSFVTKTKLIEVIARGTGLTKQETEAVLSGFTETVKETLSRGEPVDIRGFGSFRVQERAARNARNLATGEIMHVEAKKVPVFRPSREFKDRVLTRDRE